MPVPFHFDTILILKLVVTILEWGQKVGLTESIALDGGQEVT